jgi:lipase
VVGQPVRTVVAGLTCAQWSPGAERTVLALHGLTSTSQNWSALAEALPGHRIVAPDLPGRGGSAEVTAPPGLAGHALAVVAVAEELDLRDVTLVGHSMGAFLAPLVAKALGERVTRVVLVDGGLPPEPSLLVRRPVVKATFTMQAKLLGRRWPSAEAFAESTEGRALASRPDLRETTRQWAGYLLDATGHARLDKHRLVEDAADTLAGTPTLDALDGHPAPVHFLGGAHGSSDSAKPFISDAAVEAGLRVLPRLTWERVEANHVTLLAHPALYRAVT